MILKAYLQKHDISVQAFALRLGVSDSSVWHYLSGRRLPSPEVAARIVLLTGGEVSIYDLRGNYMFEELRGKHAV